MSSQRLAFQINRQVLRPGVEENMRRAPNRVGTIAVASHSLMHTLWLVITDCRESLPPCPSVFASWLRKPLWKTQIDKKQGINGERNCQERRNEAVDL